MDELRQIPDEIGNIWIKDPNSQKKLLDMGFLEQIVHYAVQGLSCVDGKCVLDEVLRSLYSGHA